MIKYFLFLLFVYTGSFWTFADPLPITTVDPNLNPPLLDAPASATQTPTTVNAQDSQGSELLEKGGEKAYKAKDYSQAMKFYLKAAQLGNSNAEENIGVLYHNGSGVNQDFHEAMTWYLKAAEKGNDYAENGIGVLYQNGQGVEQDYREAMKWFLKAAQQGNLISEFCLGQLYEKGLGISQNYNEAIKWFRKAADNGDAGAENEIGNLYNNGEGVGRDYQEAMKWYLKSAEQGNPLAEYNAGIAYDNGRGVTIDYQEAIKWYLKAADQNVIDADFNLGTIYEFGKGVSVDYSEAVKWYQKAADLGDEESAEKVSTLSTKENSNIAARLVAFFKPAGETRDVQDILVETLATVMLHGHHLDVDTGWSPVKYRGDVYHVTNIIIVDGVRKDIVFSVNLKTKRVQLISGDIYLLGYREYPSAREIYDRELRKFTP